MGQSRKINRRRFPARRRVKKRQEFLAVQGSGRRLYCRHFILFLLQRQNNPVTRLGITVSTKVSKKAVVRNRVKRLVREVFRMHHSRIRCCFDIVVIARHNASDCTFAEVKRELMGALYHNGYLES